MDTLLIQGSHQRSAGLSQNSLAGHGAFVPAHEASQPHQHEQEQDHRSPDDHGRLYRLATSLLNRER